MAHGITQYDNGAVGFCEVFGGTWHRLPQYEQLNGEVTLDKAREILGYEVVKVPLALHVPADSGMNQKMLDSHGKLAVMPSLTSGGDNTLKESSMYALVRTDHGIPVFGQSVSEEYEIFPNCAFLDNIKEQLLTLNSELKIESCGSLWGGRVAFLNIMMEKFAVKGDCSETVSRLMFWNAFGGRSISACGHNTRVVCNNTSMMAEAQGAMNKSLKKFKHTSGAPKRVTNHFLDIAEMHGLIAARKEALDYMAGIQMNTADVNNFLGHLLPIPKDAGAATVTRRTNVQVEIKSLFETAPDVQGAIARTRYAMWNAVTAYNQHHTLSKDVDAAYSWFNVATGGNRHEVNQTAYGLLTKPEIPELEMPDMAELQMVGKN
jgi:hypothetical protein